MFRWLRSLLTVPEFEDRDITRVARILNVLLWAYVVVLLAFVAGAYIISPEPPRVAGVPLGLGGLLVLAILFWLIRTMRRGRVRLVAVLMTGAVLIANVSWMWISGGVTDNRTALMYVLVIAFAGLMLGRWTLLIFTALSMLGVYGAYLAEQSGRIVPDLQPMGIPGMAQTMAAFVVLAVLVYQGRRGLNLLLEEAQRSAQAQERTNRQMRTMQSDLDARVQQRTEELEIRANLLQTAVEVGGTAVSMRTPDELIATVADTMSRQFGFYHVGVYLADAAVQRAGLQAVGGEPGGEIPKVGYEIPMHDGAVIGECLRTGEPYIAFGDHMIGRMIDVGEVRVSAHIARLPRTSVEVALPLSVGGRTVGVLDLHLDQAGSFRLIDLEAWQIVADQLTIALENARRYAQSQEALEVQQAYLAQTSREGWRRLLLDESVPGYRYRNNRVEPLDDVWPAALDEAVRADTRVLVEAGTDGGAAVAVPVRARGTTIGSLHLEKRPSAGGWTNRELQLLDTLTVQLETALESARLYRDTRTAAAQQQTIAEVSASIRGEVEIEAVLSRALTELGNALAAEQGSVLLTLGEEPGEDSRPQELGLSGDAI